MEEKKIDNIKKWLESKSVWNIQVFIDFANFHRRFIKGFSKIAVSLTAMLKTTRSSVASASRVDKNEVAGDGRSIGADDRSVDRLNTSKKATMSKNQTNNGHPEEFKFLTSGAKEVFNYLKQTFTKVPILWYFDPKCHIRMKTDVSSYAMVGVLS